MLSTGQSLPSCSLKDLEGQGWALTELAADAAVLLALFKVGCPVCQLALPYLERIAQGSLKVVAISQDTASATERFRKSFGLTFPILVDAEEDGYPASNAFGITHVPSLFLVEAGGVISSAGSGFRKSTLEELGRRSGVATFHSGENVPEWKAG